MSTRELGRLKLSLFMLITFICLVLSYSALAETKVKPADCFSSLPEQSKLTKQRPHELHFIHAGEQEDKLALRKEYFDTEKVLRVLR